MEKMEESMEGYIFEDDVESDSEVDVQEVAWSWKRKAFQRQKAGINGYVRGSILRDIRTELEIVGDDVLQEFVNSCFGCYMEFNWKGYSSNATLHALIAQEIRLANTPDDELWFRVGEQHIRFSKYEFALVTGLRFGDSAFDPNVQHNPPESSVYVRRLQSLGRLSIDQLRDHFSSGFFRHTPGDALKVAKVLFVYYILFAVDGGKAAVDRWMWTLVEDHERWENFPWGKFSFQILLHYINALPTTLHKPSRRPPVYHFYGCTFPLLIWAYEAIPQLGFACASRISTDLIPRFRRWAFNKVNLDMTSYFYDELECSPTLEPCAEELKQIYWQHIDEDIRSGVQFIHKDTRFRVRESGQPRESRKRSRPSTTNASVPIRSIRTPRVAAEHINGAQTDKTTSAAATTEPHNQPLRLQKQQRLGPSGHSGGASVERNVEPGGGSGDDLLRRIREEVSSVVRDEVGKLECSIRRIVRTEIRHMFHYCSRTFVTRKNIPNNKG